MIKILEMHKIKQRVRVTTICNPEEFFYPVREDKNSQDDEDSCFKKTNTKRWSIRQKEDNV